MEAPQFSLDEVDKRISDAEYVLSSLTRSDPRFPHLIHLLGLSRLHRYMLSDDQQDIDKSLIYLTHAILLPPYPLSIHGRHPIISLFLLPCALLIRSYELEQLSGVECCVKFLHFFRDRLFGAFGIEYDDVTRFLVRALSLQAQWNPECRAQDLEKISALCSELLASNVNESLLDDAISALAHTIINFMSTTPGIVFSPQIIECLREANRRLPHSRIVSRVLFMSLFTRLSSTTSHGDFEDAMATLEGIVASHSAAGTLDEDMRDVVGEIKLLSFFRYALNGNPEYLEEAIFRFRTSPSKIPFDDPQHAMTTQDIAMLEDIRFSEFGIVHDRQESHSDDPGVVDISDLIAPLAKSNTGKYTFEELCRHHRAVQALTMDRITNMPDIEGAIKYCRLLLASLQQCPNEEVMLMTTLDWAVFLPRVQSYT
ncbi:hypothetical protein BC827DRAFT_1273902 [Russula dissimulans]|nr:hypothetical protein BC827DRAFT_1273902 [Russula dissimulans]